MFNLHSLIKRRYHVGRLVGIRRTFNHCRVPMLLGLTYLAGWNTFRAANAEPQCRTAFARIARVEIEKLVSQQKAQACKKLNLFGVNVTKDLTLNSLDICEDGSKVTAKVDFSFACATPENSVLQTTVGSKVQAKATADFHTCGVDVTTLSVADPTLQQAIDGIEGKKILSGFVATTIAPYCDH